MNVAYRIGSKRWRLIMLIALLGSLLLATTARAATGLSVTISDSRAAASPGDILNFLVQIDNASGAVINGGSVGVTLSANTTFVAASSGSSVAGPLVSWGSQSFPTGTSFYFVSARVDTGTADGTILTTGVSATYGTEMPSTGTDTTTVRRPVVTFTPTSVASFGNVVVGVTSAAKTIKLKNTGSADLSLSSIVISGNFAQTNDCPAVLAPNQECTLTITFTPTATGPRTGTLTVTDNAANSPQTLNLSGTGTQPALTASRTTVAFGSILVNTVKTETVDLTNTGSATLTITSISTPGAPFSRSNCGATLAPNAKCTLTLSFSPTAIGTFNDSVVVTTNGGNATITLSGTAINPGSSLDKSSLDFGSQRINTSASQNVVLTNNGSDPLTIASITRTGDAAFTVGGGCPISPATLLNGASCTITVIFAPTSLGAMSGSITITSNAAASPQTITLVGSGAEPGLTVTPTSFNFGNVLLGSSAGPQAITLTNDGAAPLSISGITLSGDFSKTSTCVIGSALAGGASCTVDVTFTPGVAGSRSGALTIFHDANNSPTLVNLTGAGVTPAPAVTFSPTSLAFSGTTVGATSAAQTVTLTNSGTASLAITTLQTTGDFDLASEDCPDSLAVNATCTINVIFTPTAGGARTGTLAMVDNAAGSPHTVALTGTGLAPRYTSNPGVGTLNLSSLIGSTNSVTIVVGNSGAATLNVSAPTAAVAAPFSVSPATAFAVAVGASQNVTVTCAPTAAGPFSQTLTYTTNDPTLPTATYTIICTGTAQATATYASSPAPGATLNIGDVIAGQSGSATLAIRETGTAALAVGLKGGTLATAITGANASSFSIAPGVFPLSIADNAAEKTVVIECRPRAEGALVATLELTTNDPVQPTVRYALTCSGLGQPIFSVFTPITSRAATSPDLVVTSLSVTPTALKAGDAVRVVAVVENMGETATGAFWVDLYIDPTTPPTTANLPWNETCGAKQPCYGLAWLVPGLAPGASITLTSDAGSFAAANSNWNATLAAGTSDIYLYADSWNRDDTSGGRVAEGAVRESSETNNRAEVRGLVVAPGAAQRNVVDPANLPTR